MRTNSSVPTPATPTSGRYGGKIALSNAPIVTAKRLVPGEGSRLYTDSASSYQALKGYLHEYVNHTKKEYARGEVYENRAECLYSLLKPFLRVFRGISKVNLPGYLGFFQFLRNARSQNVFQQAKLILYAALDPSVASKARRGEFVTCLDHFDLLQTPIT
jgi:transposase